MNRSNFRNQLLVILTGLTLLTTIGAPARAVERALLGIHIYSNVKTVLRKFGNPNYVLNAGQTYGLQTSSLGTYSNGTIGGAAQTDSAVSANALPPLQPAGSPLQPFGAAPPPAGSDTAQGGTTPDTNGEVALVYEKGNGTTYEFLLSTSGSVVQITALGYSDPLAKTTKAIHFGSTYSQLINRYGYPENQSQTDGGIRIVDYSKRAHVAFELLNNNVVGIVVAAID